MDLVKASLVLVSIYQVKTLYKVRHILKKINFEPERLMKHNFVPEQGFSYYLQLIVTLYCLYYLDVLWVCVTGLKLFYSGGTFTFKFHFKIKM